MQSVSVGVLSKNQQLCELSSQEINEVSGAVDFQGAMAYGSFTGGAGALALGQATGLSGAALGSLVGAGAAYGGLAGGAFALGYAGGTRFYARYGHLLRLN